MPEGARAAAQKLAVNALVELHSIMVDDAQPGATRVLAANSILDRALGKPTPTPFSDKETPAIDADAIRRRVEDACRATEQMMGQLTENDCKAGNAFFGEQAY